MKATLKTTLFGAASYVLLSISSQGTVIFTDAFASGTGSWFKGGASGSGSLTNSSGQLSWAPASSAAASDVQSIARSFAAQNLAVGQTIRLTMDYTQSLTATNDIIRVGIYNAANTVAANQWSMGVYSGYYGFIRDNHVAANGLRSESTTDTSALTTNGPTVNSTVSTFGSALNTTLAGATTTFDIVQGTAYRLIFDVTRTSSTQTDLAFKLTNSTGSIIHHDMTGSTTVTTAQYNDFDTIVIRPNGTSSAGIILLDNIEVSVIPEPSAALLGGFGVLLLFRRRR